MVWVPTPAVVGLNIPNDASVIPFPDHVPPGVAAVNVTGLPFEQKGPAGLMVELNELLIYTSVLAVAVHPLDEVTVTV